MFPPSGAERLTKALFPAEKHWEKRREAMSSQPPTRPALPPAFTIVVSREVGAGGGLIAHTVGLWLGWPVYDRQLVEQIAGDLGVHARLLRSIAERHVSQSDVVAHLCTADGKSCRQGPTPVAVLQLRRRRKQPRVAPEPSPELTIVRDVMTPGVFSVALGTPADCVVNALLSLSIHRVFVTDDDGSLVGVISSTDILRHLKRPAAAPRDEKEVLCSADLMK
jgi:CBS domain-containing protein